MKFLIPIILLSLFASFLLHSTSCAFKSSKSNYPILASEKEIDDFLMSWMKANQSIFDWKHAPDNILYSALMYGDSTLSIDYFIDSTKDKRELYKQHKTLPSNWLNERDKIITYIVGKERRYRKKPSIGENELLPFGKDDKLAVIDIKISDPSIILELRKNYYVYLATNYLPPSLR